MITSLSVVYYSYDQKDMINHQRFVRRLKIDTVTLDRLYLSNIINIYGRQMTITEYADSCTEQYLAPKRERYLLLTRQPNESKILILI
jgi:hypothetical protein